MHRDRHRGRLARRAGARRHGLHRGDRRRAVLRDARITTIYEGTTGIQANDLVGRKTAREAGATAKAWLASLKALDAELGKSANADIKALRAQLAAGCASGGGLREFHRREQGPARGVCRRGAVPQAHGHRRRAAGRWRAPRSPPRRSSPPAISPSWRRRSRPRGSTATTSSCRRAALRDTVVKGAPAVMALGEDQFLAA